ncbi:MYOC-like protein [Mya arenaria]|uniref:MYOC-like protein n=1 Tax=Mya arenaria TaxID=6604 RepID=A0ABY7DYL6_MYAAR|nr:MYOC-like protein [Mya arenaria]
MPNIFVDFVSGASPLHILYIFSVLSATTPQDQRQRQRVWCVVWTRARLWLTPTRHLKIWVMYSFSNINELSQYTSIKEARFLGERQLEHVGVHDSFPYQSGKNRHIDETGLWVIYATNSSNGCIVISKLNEDVSFEDTWQKKHVGNAFIICVILYATNAYDEVPTFIKYTFDTRTTRGKVLEPGVLPFRNSVSGDYAKVYALDYSPSDKPLYSWNNGRVEIFPVSFVDDSDP